MIEPVEVQQIALAAILGGAIIFFGAVYAVFYALSKLRSERRLSSFAYLAYVCLVIVTVGIAQVLNLNGWWLALIVVLLVGYFIAPRFIWHLSEAVHEDVSDDSNVTVRTVE